MERCVSCAWNDGWVKWNSYIALGDSFTEGVADEEVGSRHIGWADRLAAELATRHTGNDFRYANLAIRGRKLPQILSEQVPVAARMNADLVSLAGGVNDALRPSWDAHKAEQEINDAVVALRASGADVLLVAFGDPGIRSRALGLVSDRLAIFNQCIRDVAAEHGCYVLDFGDAPAFNDSRLWASDRLHLNPEGHRRTSLGALESLGLSSDSTWTQDLPESLNNPNFVVRRMKDAEWTVRFLAPWIGRRVTGRSSGDQVMAKRPSLTPMTAADLAATR